MKSPFNEAYSQQLVSESIKNIINSPKALIATALMLGIVDVGYIVPKLNEIKQKVEQILQQKTPEQVEQIENSAVQQQNAPKVQNIASKINAAWKNYRQKPPTAKEKQSYADAAAKKQQVPNAANKQLSQEFYNKAKQMLKQDEGKKSRLYKDTKGKWTIGYGHLIKSKSELKKYKGKTLSDKEINDLLDVDINSKVQIAQRLFPKFKEYSDDFKITILNGIFRGDLSGSPRTIELINKGLYKQAAKEYLDNDDYIADSKPKAHDKGVAIRMYRNAQNIAKQATK
jgi:GH24 family phage-related lysozyme (muramidase)